MRCRINPGGAFCLQGEALVENRCGSENVARTTRKARADVGDDIPGLAPQLRNYVGNFRFLAGTSILWMYWSAGKLREAGAFVEAGGGEDQKSAADNRREVAA
jgi:hypothetical protein